MKGSDASGDSINLSGGPGGFAGIHVPQYDEEVVIHTYDVDENNVVKIDNNGDVIILSSRTLPAGSATLNLSGDGVIKCYGGSAGSGGSTSNNVRDSGAGGGGGAGAGIGGNGGSGGSGGVGYYGISKTTNELNDTRGTVPRKW